jgi:nucleotide-binding universal stress UspA family protein
VGTRSSKVVDMARIVVGIDGSADSRAALDWAINEARFRSDTVKAVYVYGVSAEHNPFLKAYSSFATASTAQHTGEQAQRWQEEREEALRQQASGTLSSVVHEVTEANPGVKVDQITVGGGRPARELLRQAGDCSVLVVGARGQGGFRGLRLGSIAEKCVRHAPCSVMVARAK